MSRSKQVSVHDIHLIYRLIHECREMGDDPVLWRQHWLDGLDRRLGAGVTMGGEMRDVRAGMAAHDGFTERGWEQGFNRKGWERTLSELDDDPQMKRQQTIGTYCKHLVKKDGVCLARTDMIADRDWYTTWDWENVLGVMGIDNSMWCFRSMEGMHDRFHGVVICRAFGDPDFTGREKALVTEAQRLIGPLVGKELAGFLEPSPSDLPPRVRQVLRCLLEGDGDKQVAARLGISRYTVNEYVKTIFGHFGVVTRTELLARWLRRGWTAHCAWIEPSASAFPNTRRDGISRPDDTP